MTPRQLELVVRRPGQMERRVPLQPGTISLGRGEMNDVVLTDIGISRRHARLHVGQEGVLVEDAGSGNGTWFRGQRVNRQILGPGDEIVIEPFTLLFEDVGADLSVDPRSDPDSTLQSAEIKPGARLTVVSGHKVEKADHLLPALGTITLGRSEKNLIVLPEPAASRVHAEVLCGDVYTLRDLGSSNGTFINGKRVRTRVLADGDRIRIGSFEMRFGVIGTEVTDDPTDATEQFAEVLHGDVPLAKAKTALHEDDDVPPPVQPLPRAPAKATAGMSRPMPPPTPVRPPPPPRASRTDPVTGADPMPAPLMPAPRKAPRPDAPPRTDATPRADPRADTVRRAEAPPLMPGQPDEVAPVAPAAPPRRKAAGVPAWVPLIGLFAFAVVFFGLLCAGVISWELFVRFRT